MPLGTNPKRLQRSTSHPRRGPGGNNTVKLNASLAFRLYRTVGVFTIVMKLILSLAHYVQRISKANPVVAHAHLADIPYDADFAHTAYVNACAQHGIQTLVHALHDEARRVPPVA